MDLRVQFIAAVQQHQHTVSELCEYYGISRKTGYKWIARYEEEGPSGLADRSRKPKSNSRQVPDSTRKLILRERRKRPRWGPLKLRKTLATRHPDLELPAPSTIGRILKAEGLTKKRRRRRCTPPYGQPFQQVTEPNDCWCADFKGQFRLGNREYCYPFTVSDAFSRFFLVLKALDGTKHEGVRRALELAFRAHGLPRAIRTDNGPPFATTAPCGISRLTVWWIKLGIVHERIEPGRPDQNGRLERAHRTVGEETADPPKSTPRAQQMAFTRFRSDFNFERPHQALGQVPPAEVYNDSPRPYPREIPGVEYEPDVEVRKVDRNGAVWFKGVRFHLTKVLQYEYVGLEEVLDGLWEVRFGPLKLGTWDQRCIEGSGFARK